MIRVIVHELKPCVIKEHSYYCYNHPVSNSLKKTFHWQLKTLELPAAGAVRRISGGEREGAAALAKAVMEF